MNMETVFLKIMNMSITASWLVLAVLLMRLLLKKAPKFLSVIMWALVGLRLVLPFSFESIFSLIPSAETVPPEILYEQAPQVQTGIEAFNSAINPVITESFAPTPGTSVNPLQIITWLAGWIWIIGMAVMVIYSLISCLRICRKLREAAPLQDNIWLCDRINTPFIFGLFRPRIYLPSNMAAQDIPYVLAHEQAHLKRKDHLWKPLGFLLLTIHWFNPLLWLAYILLCRDIEAACDEKVLKDMGEESKKPYSTALVNCSVPRKMIAACPLAFGEVNVKSRIKKVLHYKKPAFWLLITAVVACIVLSVCFLTNPRTVNAKMQVFLDCQIAEHHQSEKSEGHACCLDYQILGTKKSGKTTTVYMWVLYEEYSYENGQLQQETGFHTPTVITATKEDGNYRLVEYFTPRDGAYNPGDIKAKFPWYLWGKALDSQRHIDRQQKACREMAEQYFAENPPTEQPSLSVDILDSQYAILDYTHDLIDKVDYDIDNDGVKELCELYHGPTSGLFTFVLAAYEDGELEYCNVFMSDWGELSFQEQADGSVGVLLTPDSTNPDELLLELYTISLSDGNIQLLLGNKPLEYWGPQGVDAVIYDDYGLHMHLEWENSDILYAVFDYQSNEYHRRVTTSSEYELRVIHNGKRWPFADYVRKVMGLDYPAQKAETQWITYTITPDKPVSIPIYLNDLGIDLPAGTYEISKEVEVQIEDVIYTREYTAQFAIVEESASATCKLIELCYQGNRLHPLPIDDPDICNYLTEQVLSAQANGKQGESTKGYYGALYSMDIYWEGRDEPLSFTLWDDGLYSTSEHCDSEGYAYFYKADLSKLLAFLEQSYPVETWYPSPGGTSVREAFDVTVSYAGGANSGALYSDALNRDKMAISSARHLPIYKIDTRDELDLFVGNYIGISNSAVLNAGWDEVPYFTATLSQYDDAFFAENTLMLVYVSCRNCTHRFDVDSIYRDSQTLYISVEETTGAEVVDDAMADWFIAVAVPDNMVETCKQFDAELGNFRNL